MNITIVYPDSPLRIASTSFLVRLGHEVVCRGGAGELARDATPHPTPDVLLVELPGSSISNGALEAVNRRYPDVPIIGIVDYGSVLRTQEAEAYGVYGYLHKPFSLAELDLMLRQLERRAGPQEPAITVGADIDCAGLPMGGTATT